MLNSGSFGHIWMARMLHSSELFILKRIRIVISIQLNHFQEKGIESLFSARREIFFGTLLRGVEGIAKYEECFVQDIGLIMNTTPFLPDRIISLPWLSFQYGGVSLAQMIYSQSASDKACNGETSLSKFHHEKSSEENDKNGLLVHPSVPVL